MRGRVRFCMAAVFSLGAVLLVVRACDEPADPTYTARDPALRSRPLYFYPAAGPEPARAFVFFFGNDVGFWAPHRRLAIHLAEQGFDVVGFDLKPLVTSLFDFDAGRDSTFAAEVGRLVAASRHELRADARPVVLAGHSLGAEVAVWSAVHVPIPDLIGVLALSPGSRSHLGVSLSDLVNGPEPTGAGSFSVAREVSQLPPAVRLAVVRGENDDYQSADAAILAAGGPRSQRYVVRFAGHSLKRIIVARPAVRQALAWILAPRTVSTPP